MGFSNNSLVSKNDDTQLADEKKVYEESKLLEDYRELKEEIEGLKKERDELDNSWCIFRDDLKDENKTLKGQLEDDNRQVHQLFQENKKLKEQMEGLYDEDGIRDNLDILGPLLDIIDKDEYDELQEENKKLKEELEEKEKEVSLINSEEMENEEEIAKIKEEYDELQEENKKLKEKMDSIYALDIMWYQEREKDIAEIIGLDTECFDSDEVLRTIKEMKVKLGARWSETEVELQCYREMENDIAEIIGLDTECFDSDEVLSTIKEMKEGSPLYMYDVVGEGKTMYLGHSLKEAQKHCQGTGFPIRRYYVEDGEPNYDEWVTSGDLRDTWVWQGEFVLEMSPNVRT